MPANKNAVVRYMYLDQMLSDRRHNYTRSDLWRKCNERLERDGYAPVSKRTIELDLVDLGMPPFGMDIDDSLVVDGRHIVRYSDQSVSLFSRPLSDDEKKLLREAIGTMGQFSGLDNFEWVAALQEKLDDGKSFGGRSITEEEGRRKIISFSSNPYLRNINLLGRLFTSISDRKVISVQYRKFDQADSSTFVVYPYLLKEYNNRWFLICNPVGNDLYPYRADYIMSLPLDRILSFTELGDRQYVDCPLDLEERFDDIVGVTYYEDRKIEKILIAVAPLTVNYIRTKPLHSSQAELREEEQEEQRRRYPALRDYVFLTLECIPNNELHSLLYGYGKGLVVVSPVWMREKLRGEAAAQVRIYDSL